MTEINKTKEITVRLTNDHSVLSFMTFFAGLGGPTHAAIGLDDKDEFFYSFNTKGFKKEYLNPRKKRRLKATNYKLRVSEESYHLLKEKIQQMYEERKSYGYSGFGVALCFMRFPVRIHFKKRYFCSQFVAEVLTETGCLDVKKKPELCFPKRIEKELRKSNELVEVSTSSDLVTIPQMLLNKTKSGRDLVIRATFKYSLPIYNKTKCVAFLWQLKTRFLISKFMRMSYRFLREMCDEFF